MHGTHTDSVRPPSGRSSSVYRVRHDPDGPATISTTVAHALADCMDIDVTDTDVSLYDSVDPDALDRLFRPRHDGRPRAGGHVSFDVAGYWVTVHSDGRIVIDLPPGAY